MRKAVFLFTLLLPLSLGAQDSDKPYSYRCTNPPEKLYIELHNMRPDTNAWIFTWSFEPQKRWRGWETFDPYEEHESRECYLKCLVTDNSADLAEASSAFVDYPVCSFRTSDDTVTVHFKQSCTGSCHCEYVPQRFVLKDHVRFTIELIPDSNQLYFRIWEPRVEERYSVDPGMVTDVCPPGINLSRHYLNPKTGRIKTGAKWLRPNNLQKTASLKLMVIDPLWEYKDRNGKLHKGSELIRQGRIRKKDFDMEEMKNEWNLSSPYW